jgi:hypothetical protein
MNDIGVKIMQKSLKHPDPATITNTLVTLVDTCDISDDLEANLLCKSAIGAFLVDDDSAIIDNACRTLRRINPVDNQEKVNAVIMVIGKLLCQKAEQAQSKKIALDLAIITDKAQRTIHKGRPKLNAHA